MKNMNGLTPRAIIRQTILTMDRPFNMSDLFYLLETAYKITNRQLILNIVEELCESGVIKYSEVIDDCWAFEVVRRMPGYANAST